MPGQRLESVGIPDTSSEVIRSLPDAGATFTETTDAPADVTTPYAMASGDTFHGTFNTLGDSDWIAITLQAGVEYDISLLGLADEYPRTELALYNAAGQLLYEADIAGRGTPNVLTYVSIDETGTYYINAASQEIHMLGNYSLEVTNPPRLPLYTNDQIADQLTDGYWENLGETRRAFAASPGDTITVQVPEFVTARRAALDALDAWSDVTGLHFQEVSSNAQITFGSTTDEVVSNTFSNVSAGISRSIPPNIFPPVPFPPPTTSFDLNGTEIVSADVSIGWQYNHSRPPTMYNTYVQEIGHALGLGRAGNYEQLGGVWGDNHYANDSFQASVMSEISQLENRYIDASYALPVTPMVTDIIALHNLYGAPTDIRTGNTIYGFNSNAGGILDRIVTDLRYTAFTIYDNGASTRWIQRIHHRPDT